ncbi:hypothetical protein J6590_043131 [Homalodisca vitripennis]|nr:hypothetical protein J6590_043131 [Homalodisca vitripennis]
MKKNLVLKVIRHVHKDNEEVLGTSKKTTYVPETATAFRDFELWGSQNAKDNNDPTLKTRLDMRQTRFRKIEASRNEISKQNWQKIRSAVAQDRKKTRYGYRLDHRTEK